MNATIEQLLPSAIEIANAMKGEIIARHIAAGQYATGKTSSTLRIVPTAKGFQLHGWQYAGTYEEGRQPGGAPPVDALIEWAQAKGIDFGGDEKRARNWAFALSKKIAREGTARYRLSKAGQPVDIFQTPIQTMQERLAKQTLLYIGQQVTKELTRIDISKE